MYHNYTCQHFLSQMLRKTLDDLTNPKRSEDKNFPKSANLWNRPKNNLVPMTTGCDLHGIFFSSSVSSWHFLWKWLIWAKFTSSNLWVRHEKLVLMPEMVWIQSFRTLSMRKPHNVWQLAEIIIIPSAQLMYFK